MTARRAFKYVTVTIATCCAIVLAFYLFVLFVNRHDRPPSATVIRFQEMARRLPPVADKDNAYVFFAGLSAQKNDDPALVGAQRIAWVLERRRHKDIPMAADFPGKSHDFASSRSATVSALAAKCKDADLACVRALEASPETVAAWLESEAWLFERYNKLLSFPEWRETLDYDVRDPVLPAHPAFEAQKLLMLQAWVKAGEGHSAAIKALLDADVRYWRRNLAANDTLLSKMVSGAALKRHFAWSNIILRRLPADNVAAAIPGSWHTPISPVERSMLRSLVGEWRFTSKEMARLNDGNMEVDGESSDDEAGQKLSARLARSVFQLQDSSNQYAEHMAAIADTLDVDYQQLPAAVITARAASRKLQEKSYGNGVYNWMGGVLFRVGISDMTLYASRIADIEGVRRATLLAAQLRGHGIRAGEAPQQLGPPSQGNPYDGKPFVWDPKEQALVFVGLATGERSRISIPY